MNDSQHISTDDFAAFPPDFPNSGGLLTSFGILQGLQRSACFCHTNHDTNYRFAFGNLCLLGVLIILFIIHNRKRLQNPNVFFKFFSSMRPPPPPPPKYHPIFCPWAPKVLTNGSTNLVLRCAFFKI